MTTVDEDTFDSDSSSATSPKINNQQQLNNNNGGTASSKWAEIAAKPPSPPKNKIINTKKSNKIRTTTTTSSQKKNRKSQRSNLHSLGVNNSRVLDIHYPSRTVVALLVHNDYREEIIMILKKHGVSNLPDYTPTHHTTISDPQFKNLSVTEKSSLAIEKNNHRLVRALPFIRDHIAKAVARFFKEQSWITKDQLDSFIQSHNEKIATTITNQNSL
ncbi:hypothetical protein BD770DRAFT_410256 [Pilaira anomala]|nr:hypothetical protein BD770DRAFT_410256 [Pilaira anomala]